MRVIIDKLRKNHLLVMLACCLAPLAAVYVGVTYLGWSRNILLWSVILLCPLSLILLMRGHGKDPKVRPKVLAGSQNLGGRKRRMGVR